MAPLEVTPYMEALDLTSAPPLARIETLLDMYGLSWELTSEPGTGTTFTCEVGHAAEWNPVIEPLKRKAGNG